MPGSVLLCPFCAGPSGWSFLADWTAPFCPVCDLGGDFDLPLTREQALNALAYKALGAFYNEARLYCGPECNAPDCWSRPPAEAVS